MNDGRSYSTENLLLALTWLQDWTCDQDGARQLGLMRCSHGIMRSYLPKGSHNRGSLT